MEGLWRCDVYSFGRVAHWLVMGSGGRTRNVQLDLQRKGWEKEAAAMVDRMCEVKPEMRPGSWDEIIEALEKLC